VEGNRAIPTKAEKEENDPTVNAFLIFLECDIHMRSDSVRKFPSELLDRGMALTKGIEVDMDAPIEIEG
jgi:antitoxin PrlF